MLEKKIYPPIGPKLKCKNWQIEAAYRMIQHNVCNEVAEYLRANCLWRKR